MLFNKMISKIRVITKTKNQSIFFSKFQSIVALSIYLTHKTDWIHQHHRNGRNSALFVSAERVHHDPNTVGHNIRITDAHDVIYYLDHLFFCA